MSVIEVHLIFVGIPLLLVAVLAALIWRHKGPHPTPYQMSEPWTHSPILWASDEVVGGHGHGAEVLTVGGGASGKW